MNVITELLNKANGYKTYLTAAAMFLTGLVELIGSLSDGTPSMDGLTLMMEALGFSAVRHGIEKINT